MINSIRTYLHARLARGFTLIETLVAVLILSMTIVGPLTIASKGLQAALIAKDQVIAYYLAQDAIEYVRFARDTNSLHSGWNWLDADGNTNTSTNLSPCISTDGSAVCHFDSLDQNPSEPLSGSGGVLYYNSSTHYFYYGTASPSVPTPFTRTVSITSPVGGNEASVTVRVTWTDAPSTVVHTVSVKEDLYNWH